MRRRWAAGLIAGLCLVAGSASAQTYTTTISPLANAPGLGRVTRGASATVFTINATTGAVSQSGPGIRVPGGSVTTPTITIRCDGGGCNSNRILVTITSLTSPPANFTLFSVGGLSCAPGCTAVFTDGTPTPASPLTFRLGGVGNNKTATFKVGPQVTIASSGATGPKTFGMQVSASVTP